MKITAEPRSDQINAEDLIGGAETYTIAGVREGKAEQKYDIALEDHDRVWRPPLTVLRVLIKCWGNEADEWIGRRVTLYCDESVTFGKEAVGGIRVSHLSHIDKPQSVSVTASRGRRQKINIQPLKDAPPQPAGITQQKWDAVKAAATAQGVDDLQGWLTEQLGRTVNRWQEITAVEGESLEKVLTTGETG